MFFFLNILDTQREEYEEIISALDWRAKDGRLCQYSISKWKIPGLPAYQKGNDGPF
jgi:hypothetical protein